MNPSKYIWTKKCRLKSIRLKKISHTVGTGLQVKDKRKQLDRDLPHENSFWNVIIDNCRLSLANWLY